LSGNEKIAGEKTISDKEKARKSKKFPNFLA
jgi:hypothetical protein